MRTLRLATALALSIAAAADSGAQTTAGTDMGPAGRPMIENLGLAIAAPLVYTSADLVAFRVDERSQGDTDLNGDGDAFDHVVHVVDLDSGTLRNLGVASRYQNTAQNLPVAGPLLVLPVQETEQNSTDLNGDGDLDDHVLHVYDARTGLLTNVGLATTETYDNTIAVDGDAVVFSVPETSAFGSGQGVDLNGDGDVLGDEVVHVYRADTGTVTNLGIAATIFPFVGHGRAAIPVREASQGMTDLNGDGDAGDVVMHTVDLATGAVTNLGLASGPYAVVTEEVTAFLALEEFQGGTDLNGDGDAVDWVLHTVDAGPGSVRNLGLALQPSSYMLLEGAGRIAFIVAESQQDQTDLNADGDAGDFVLHTLDPAGTVDNHGLAVRLGGSAAIHPLGNETLYVFQVDEERQGETDLNGDGDDFDDVTHYLTASGDIVNVGLAASGSGGAELSDGLISIVVYEIDQGQQDLNGDGDGFDRVVHVHNACVGTTTNLGLASGTARDVAIGGGFSAVLVRESNQGMGSLNSDGDVSDSVLFIRGARMPAAVNVELACNGNVEVPRDGVIVVWADERDQAFTDLNGDGDTSDNVAHIVRIR